MTGSPNVLIVHQNLETGLLYFESLQREMEKVGLRPRLLAVQPPNDGELGPRTFGYVRIQAPFPRNGYRPSISIISPKLVRTIARSGADVVVCVEYSLATLWAILGAKRSHAKVILFQEHRYEAGVIRSAWRRFLRHFPDHFIANTDAAYDQLSEQVQTPKITRLNFLVPPEFQAVTDRSHSLKVPKRGLGFLFTGQMIDRKNVELIIDAAQILKERGYEFSVLLVGSGPKQDDLGRRAQELGLSGVVTFMDRIPYTSMSIAYDWADVFVMPTWADYRSVAVLEALQAGKPVIDSSKDGNAGDSVRHNHNGFIVDPASASQLAKSMLRFIENPDLVHSMGEKSRDYMKDKTPSNSAKGLKKLIDELL